MLETNKKDARASLIFLFIVAAGIVIKFGPALHTVLLLFVILPMSAVFFSRWRGGKPTDFLHDVAWRSVAFSAVIFCIAVFWITLTKPGQLGYGAHLQIDEGRITALGYVTILNQAVFFAALVFIGGIAANVSVSKNNR